MIKYIEKIQVNVIQEHNNCRIIANSEDVLLQDVTADNIIEILRKDFSIVKAHYLDISIVKFINDADIDNISMLIVLRWLYMHNLWISEGKKGVSLRFQVGDLTHPYTYDMVLNYFKEHYPSDWKDKASIVMKMNLNSLDEYVQKRQEFYNK
jgi:hypothetical protein